MPEYLAPGVYVEETSFRSAAIEAVDTAVPAFVGYTELGPRLEPRKVASLAEYRDLFGSGISPEPATNLVPGVPEYLLPYAIRHYFDNGGLPCWIVSAGRFDQRKRRRDYRRGLEALQSEPEPTLVVLSDAVTLGHRRYMRICKKGLEHCREVGNRFLIADVPNVDPATDVNEFRKVASVALDRGAAYYPFLETTYDSAAAGGPVALPPGPAVAGIYARNDIERGVWKAPANVALRAVKRPAVTIDDQEQQNLTVDPVAGKSINAIREFTGRGILVWGARTLAGNDNEWRYVSVRRTALMLQESVKKGTEWAVFEPNDEPLWAGIRASVTSFLQGLWRQGAFQGEKAEHAFFVRVGLGETMTQDDIDQGEIRIEVGFAPLRPAEFVIFRVLRKLHER